MEILVCVKRVPDTAENEIEVAGDGSDIERDDLVYSVNEWDNYAVEEAIQIVDKVGGSVTVISVGDEDAEEVVRREMAMGANNDSSSSSDNDSSFGNYDALGPIWNSREATPECMTKCEEDASYCDFTIEIRDEEGEIVKSKTFMGVPPRGSRSLAYDGNAKRIFCSVDDHSGDTEEDSAALIDIQGQVVAYMTATE